MNRTEAVKKNERQYIHDVIVDAEVDRYMLEYLEKAYITKQIFEMKHKPVAGVASAHLWSGNYSRMNRYDALAQETEGKIVHVNAYTYAKVE